MSIDWPKDIQRWFRGWTHTMATVSCLAASMRVRYLGVRHWIIRRGGVGVALTLLEGVAPLAQGICSQLLRILYFLALDGIDGHGLTELEDEGIQVWRPWSEWK
ncbi:hypothetical protein BC826DRAFT_967970 [Russula brevipes]|nr:hypothetical protein BC826DRAFT_967970 [Russula brevipes]